MNEFITKENEKMIEELYKNWYSDSKFLMNNMTSMEDESFDPSTLITFAVLIVLYYIDKPNLKRLQRKTIRATGMHSRTNALPPSQPESQPLRLIIDSDNSFHDLRQRRHYFISYY